MLIDTGSSTTVVSKDLAVPWPWGGPRPISGIGGHAPGGNLHHRQPGPGGTPLGPRTAVAVDELAFAKNLGWPIVEEIVGFDTFRERVFSIDLAAGEVSFPAGDCRNAIFDPHYPSIESAWSTGCPRCPGASGRSARPGCRSTRVRMGRWPWPLPPPGSFPPVARHPGQHRRRGQRRRGHGESDPVAPVVLHVFGSELPDVALQVEMPDRDGLSPTQYDDHSGGAVLVWRMGNQVLKRFRLTFDLPNHRLWAVRVDR